MYIQKRSLRFVLIFVLLFAGLSYFSFQLVMIQFFRSEHLSALAKKQQNYSLPIEPVRGTIYDRYLRPLAVNVAVYSIYANPRRMKPAEKDTAARQLAAILKVNGNELRQKLERDKYFVWLERKVPFEISEKIRHAKIKGIGLSKDSKRYYPNQSLAAHVIGFAGMDNKGLEGLELKFEKYLHGEPGYSQILRDAKQRELLIERNFLPPKDGFNLVLTIDETIQYIVERALDKAFVKSNAIAATVIVMDPKTGEILAMANRPTYDLTNISGFGVEHRVNRAIALVYEPGSVFKIVAAAAALEEGLFQEEDKIFCENGSYKVGGHILHDHHGKGWLTFSEVIEQSSNIGTTKIAQKMGPALWYKYAKLFRFGDNTDIDLLGEVNGWVKKPSQWSKTSISALPIGQEVTVTPLQLVSAISAIANDGVYMKPHIVKYVKDNNDELIEAVESQAVSRVISVQTALRLKVILKGVVERGTAKKAQISGVSVAGKTGTAQKVENGRYSSNKFFASFIGFAPVENPQLSVIVMFDDPHPDHFGGTVAAPVFRDIVADSLNYLDSQLLKP